MIKARNRGIGKLHLRYIPLNIIVLGLLITGCVTTLPQTNLTSKSNVNKAQSNVTYSAYFGDMGASTVRVASTDMVSSELGLNDVSYLDNVQSLFNSADEDWEAHRWRKAALKYKSIIDRHSSHPAAAHAHLRLANYLSFVTNPEDALIEYEQAIRKAPQTRTANEARVGMAALYHYMGEYAKSRKLFREVLMRTSDWDLVKYATYRLKEIDRQLAESTIQGRNHSQCGVSSLAKVFKIKEKEVSFEEMAKLVLLDGNMASLEALQEASEAKGLKALGVKLSLSQLKALEKPAIAHLQFDHYVVVTDLAHGKVQAFDPEYGDTVFTEQEFEKKWTGYALIFPKEGKELDSYTSLDAVEMRQVKGGSHLEGICQELIPLLAQGSAIPLSSQCERATFSMENEAIWKKYVGLKEILGPIPGPSWVAYWETYGTEDPAEIAMWRDYYANVALLAAERNAEFVDIANNSLTRFGILILFDQHTGEIRECVGSYDDEGDPAINQVLLDFPNLTTFWPQLRLCGSGDDGHVGDLGGPENNPSSGFDPGPSSPAGCNGVGLPNFLVNLTNLNLLVQDTEFSYSGLGPTVYLQRTYNADDFKEGPFGRSWSFNYGVVLEEAPNGSVTITREDGKEDFFALSSCTNGICTYSQLPWRYDVLVKNPDGTFDLSVKRTRLTQHFDSQGRLIWIADRNDHIVTLEYDANGRLDTVTDTAGRITRFFYGSNDKISNVIDPAGREATYYYDSSNNLIQTIDMAGNVISYTYDANSYMDSVTTPRGTYQITNVPYSQSASGLVVSSITDPLGNKKSYSTPENMTVQVLDANGNPWEYLTTPSAQITEVTDPLGNVTEFVYDSDGNKTGITDANGRTTNLTYDSRRNVTSITDPLGNKVTLTYDSRDNLTQLKEPPTPSNSQGNIYLYEYDSYDNLTKVTDPTNGITTFRYDSLGQLTSLTDARNNTTTFTYDNWGNVITMTTPLGYTTSYSYDSIGRITSATTPKGNTISYEYDGIDRVTEITYPDGNVVTYTYGCCSPTSVSDRNGTLTFTTDGAHRLRSFTDIHGKILQYAYDKVGNMTSLAYPDGKVVTYEYDKANRLTKVTDWLGNTVTYKYDNAGNLLSSSISNGLVTEYQYDDASRLINLANVKPDGSLISYYNYILDALGNRIGIDMKESLSQVFQANLITYTPDQDNRLISANSTIFTYDNNGNTTSKIEVLNTKSYGYDLNDRLTQTIVNGQRTQYQYDPIANRVAKTVAGLLDSEITGYVVNPNSALSQVLAETDVDGNIAAYYVYGHGLISQITPDNESYFYHFDGIGSTTAITDLSGDTVNNYSYDPFGKVLSQAETIPNPFKYVGRYGVMDEGNGLLYMRARYYDSGVGRFINKDPIGFAGGINLYVYVNNNPVIFIDPFGLDLLDAIIETLNQVYNPFNDINSGLTIIYGGLVGGTCMIAGGGATMTVSGGTGAFVGVPLVFLGGATIYETAVVGADFIRSGINKIVDAYNRPN